MGGQIRSKATGIGHLFWGPVWRNKGGDDLNDGGAAPAGGRG